MPSEAALDAVSAQVTPGPSEGALGTWRFQGDSRTQSRGRSTLEVGTNPQRKLSPEGVYVSQHLSLTDVGKACGGKPRSEPDSGNPTVRDRRGACGNVAMGAGSGCSAKAGAKPSGHGRVVAGGIRIDHRTLKARASHFYPNQSEAVRSKRIEKRRRSNKPQRGFMTKSAIKDRGRLGWKSPRTCPERG